MSKDRSKGFAVGAAIGAVAGVLTGILFAPKSGRETRQDIKDSAQKTVSKVEEEARTVQDELTKLVNTVEDKFQESKGAVTKKSKDLLAQAKEAQVQLRVITKAIQMGGADDKDLDKAIKKAKEAREALQVYLKK